MAIQIEELEYSPLRRYRKALQRLDDLLPELREMDVEVKLFSKALCNGKLKWNPPERTQEGGA